MVTDEELIQALKACPLSVSQLADRCTVSRPTVERWFMGKNLPHQAEEAGRKLVAVDPKYTSQKCAICGFTSRENRKTQAFFRCVSCGHMDNADHNGAVNILGRMCPLGVNEGEVMSCVA